MIVNHLAQRVAFVGGPLGAVFCGLFFFAPEARAQTVRFEPTDLDMVDPGQLELDTQTGFATTDGPSRIVVPDLELNLGLTPHVELDLDTQLGVEGRDQGPFHADHLYRDNLWPAAKLAIVDRRDAHHDGYGLGAQLGPKIALARGARGAGYEGVTLFGVTKDRTHVVVNLGGFVDPGREVSRKRPIALEGGLDLVYELDHARVFSILGELGGIHYFSDDDDEVHASLGVAWQPSDALQLSLVAVHGFLAGDHDALLLGVSPTVKLW